MLRNSLLVFAVLCALVPVPVFSQNHDTTLFMIEQNGQCGYMTKKGVVVISPRFDHCWKFSEGFACVVVNGKTGFIDESGEYLVRPRFSSMIGCYTEFSSGYANVSIGDARKGKEKWGFLDREGRVTYLPGVTFLSKFREGLAFFKRDGKTGYLDTKLNVAIKPKFKSAGDFYDGRARATDMDGTQYYIDKTGQKLFLNNDGGEFQDKKAFFVSNGKYGFIDIDGRMIVKAKFDQATHFGEGLAGVKIGGKWGFVNEAGELVIDPVFDEVGVFSEGMVSVAVDGKWGFADQSGQIIIPTQFDKWTYWFENGLSYVRIDGKAGYIDKTGQFIWPPSK